MGRCSRVSQGVVNNTYPGNFISDDLHSHGVEAATPIQDVGRVGASGVRGVDTMGRHRAHHAFDRQVSIRHAPANQKGTRQKHNDGRQARLADAVGVGSKKTDIDRRRLIHLGANQPVEIIGPQVSKTNKLVREHCKPENKHF